MSAATREMQSHNHHELEEMSVAGSAEHDPSQNAYPTGIRLAAVTLALVLSIFLSALDSTIIATLIPEITTEFKSLGPVGWYGSAYAMTNAAFLALWGKVYTMFDLKKTFALCVGLFELGNVICGFATSSPMLIAGRALAGAGSAGNMTGCFIIIAYAVRPDRRALFMGTLGVTFGVASVTGPLMGGAFVDHASWRWGFWINVPLGVLASVMMTFSFKTPRRPQPQPLTFREKVRHMDIPGITLALSAIAAFITAMHTIGSNAGPPNGIAVAFLLAFVVLTGAFVLNEKRMKTFAMVQSQFLKRRRFLENCVYVFFLAGLYFPLLFSLPIRFQSINNVSASNSGLRLIPLVLGISVFTMVSNAILTFQPRHSTLLLIGAVLSITGTGLASGAQQQTSTELWICFELITAAGVGLALQVPIIANQASVSAREIPAATSITLFFETVGQALFVAASEAAFTNILLREVTESSDAGIDPQLVLKAGATGFRKAFDLGQVTIITSCYSKALKASHLISMACGLCAAFAWFSMATPVMRSRLLNRSRVR